MCAHVCAFVYVHRWACVCTCACVCVCAHVCSCVCICVCAHVCMCACVCWAFLLIASQERRHSVSVMPSAVSCPCSLPMSPCRGQVQPLESSLHISWQELLACLAKKMKSLKSWRKSFIQRKWANRQTVTQHASEQHIWVPSSPCMMQGVWTSAKLFVHNLVHRVGFFGILLAASVSASRLLSTLGGSGLGCVITTQPLWVTKALPWHCNVLTEHSSIEL